MGKINGSALTITIDGTSITLLNSVSLSTSGTEVDCTNFDSGGDKELLMGTRSWTMSGSAFIDDTVAQGLKEAQAAFKANTLVAVDFTTGVTGDTGYSGNAYFTSIDATGDLDSTASWTFNLVGTGELVATEKTV